MHRREHFPHQVNDNHRYYDNAFTWVNTVFQHIKATSYVPLLQDVYYAGVDPGFWLKLE